MLESVLLVQTPNGQGANYKDQKNRCHPPRSEQEPYQFLLGRKDNWRLLLSLLILPGMKRKPGLADAL